MHTVIVAAVTATYLLSSCMDVSAQELGPFKSVPPPRIPPPPKVRSVTRPPPRNVPDTVRQETAPKEAANAAAAPPFDGAYAGTRRETRNNNSGYCRNINRDNIRVTISNSTINYRWGPIPLEATIAADGSFSVDHLGMVSRFPSVISLKGKITDGNLEADVGDYSCAGHLSLKKA
jgi:hypothetical protein